MDALLRSVHYFFIVVHDHEIVQIIVDLTISHMILGAQPSSFVEFFNFVHDLRFLLLFAFIIKTVVFYKRYIPEFILLIF